MTSRSAAADSARTAAAQEQQGVSEDIIKKKRQSTVYDAVAGRVSASGFIRDSPSVSSYRDTASSTSTAAPPENVLFQRKNAPPRYAEADFYFAHESLPANALPESDLLKAVHAYVSDFYSNAVDDAGNGDYRSMDETALLAMGILLEETCRESLGETGDMVFVEGEPTGENIDIKPDLSQRASGRGPERSVISKSEAAAKSGRTRKAKRRRLNRENSIESDG